LSAGEGSEELEELRDEARELVKKIDLNWVRVWMISVVLRRCAVLEKDHVPYKVMEVTYKSQQSSLRLWTPGFGRHLLDSVTKAKYATY
jgi:hypothetical protein